MSTSSADDVHAANAAVHGVATQSGDASGSSGVLQASGQDDAHEDGMFDAMPGPPAAPPEGGAAAMVGEVYDDAAALHYDLDEEEMGHLIAGVQLLDGEGMGDDDDGNGDAAHVRSERRTVAWYRARLDLEAMPGVGYTVKEYVCEQAKWCANQAATDAAWQGVLDFERTLRKRSPMYDAAHDLHPSSVYLIRGIIGSLRAEDIEYHPCLNCNKHCWSPLPRKAWRAVVQGESDPLYACPCCKSPRFLVKSTARGKEYVVPQHVSQMCVMSVTDLRFDC